MSRIIVLEDSIARILGVLNTSKSEDFEVSEMQFFQYKSYHHSQRVSVIDSYFPIRLQTA